MSVAIPFNLDKFRTDYQWLEGFMHKSEALQEIATLAKSLNLIQRPSKDAPYFNRWKVVWIRLTAPFYQIFSVFLRGIAYLADCLHLVKAAKVFTILSKQMIRNIHQLHVQWAFKSPLLVPSINQHQFSTWDLYQHGVFSYHSISDDRIKALTFKGAFLKGIVKIAVWNSQKSEPDSQVERSPVEAPSPVQQKQFKEDLLHSLLKVKPTDENFSQWKSVALEDLLKKHPLFDTEKCVDFIYKELEKVNHKELDECSPFSDGACRGGAFWFIFLYHQTRHLFNDPTQHLMAIAQQFTSGMPRQAALLHRLYANHKVLQLCKKNAIEVSADELDHDILAAQKKLDSLPVGIYDVQVYLHELILVKYSASEQYVWDPNFGLFPMNCREMLETIIKYYHKPGNPKSKVELKKMEMV